MIYITNWLHSHAQMCYTIFMQYKNYFYQKHFDKEVNCDVSLFCEINS